MLICCFICQLTFSQFLYDFSDFSFCCYFRHSGSRIVAWIWRKFRTGLATKWWNEPSSQKCLIIWLFQFFSSQLHKSSTLEWTLDVRIHQTKMCKFCKFLNFHLLLVGLDVGLARPSITDIKNGKWIELKFLFQFQFIFFATLHKLQSNSFGMILLREFIISSRTWCRHHHMFNSDWHSRISTDTHTIHS